jgi:hypothetical protein
VRRSSAALTCTTGTRTIVSPGGDRGTYAILSVGGFLGMGKHLVAVPFNDLQIDNRRVVLPDATRKSLAALPEFKYAPD